MPMRSVLVLCREILDCLEAPDDLGVLEVGPLDNGVCMLGDRSVQAARSMEERCSCRHEAALHTACNGSACNAATRMHPVKGRK